MAGKLKNLEAKMWNQYDSMLQRLMMEHRQLWHAFRAPRKKMSPVSPPSSFCILSCLAGGAAQEAGKPLILCKTACNNQNMGVLSAVFSCKTQNHMSFCEEN